MVEIAGKPTEYLWTVTHETVPCIEFAASKGAREDRIAITYYPFSEFQARASDVFDGTRAVASSESLRVLAARTKQYARTRSSEPRSRAAAMGAR